MFLGYKLSSEAQMTENGTKFEWWKRDSEEKKRGARRMKTVLNEKATTKKINKALKKGGEIVFKKGTYNLTDTLLLYSDTKVICEEEVVFNRKHAGRMVETNATEKTTKYNGVRNISWMGGKFKADTRNENANVITLFHASNILLSRIEVEGCRGLHSIEVNACSNVTIEECFLHNQSSRKNENFREAIQIDFANYDGLKWHNVGAEAKCYDGTMCQSVRIERCAISNCPVGIGTHTVSNNTKYHEFIYIKDNAFAQCDLQVRLCGFDNTVVANCEECKLVAKTEAHKYHGGKVALKNPRGNKRIMINNCEVENT